MPTKRDRSVETLYCKIYKPDFKIGGELYSLSAYETNVLFRLDFHADKDGYVMTDTGRGYNQIERAVICNMEKRACNVAINKLRLKGLIKVDNNGVIQIRDYYYDNEKRFKQKKPHNANHTRQELGIEVEKND